MPSTLALMKDYFTGAERQRALSYWSIGSLGGSGICSLFGGTIATTLGWRWIFIFSILVAISSYLLIKGTPESRSRSNVLFRFDIKGLTVLVVMLLSLNIVITKGATIGVRSFYLYILISIVIISVMLLIKTEKKSLNPLIDFKLFMNKPYTGATISDFLLNGVTGTLIVANTFVQQELGYTALEAGYLSITYLVMVLLMIRIGEKLLQKLGAKVSMLLGTSTVIIGISLISLTFLPETIYIISCIIGYLCFGLGLGINATPSTDTAISSSPSDKVGVASGIYKMPSSLGSTFGIAFSGAIYGVVVTLSDVFQGAMVALWMSVAMGVVALMAIIFTVPNDPFQKNI